ncbi:PH and SEC7 domain-containing protein 1-like isoform X2 [Brachyistius frenatus]|uniref:PH and SEC7 domain-containing protein 1-like isoform X2 n=1 Tax=Brachyistius frenatus TaxID=100188 RepID=UPI0037E85A44
MEEETLRSSLPHVTDLDLQRDSWTSPDERRINGEQEASVCGETGEQPGRLLPRAGSGTREEAEPWEMMIWPTRPITCASPALACATVQWDMPGLSAETPPLVTVCGSANDLGSAGSVGVGAVTSPGATSPSPRRSPGVNAELSEQEDGEEPNWIDSQFQTWTGNESELVFDGLCCNFQPCDAADVKEPNTQEQEDSARELFDGDNETPPRTDEEEEEEEEKHSVTSDPVETEDLIDFDEEVQSSDDKVDSFVDLQLEEEQQEEEQEVQEEEQEVQEEEQEVQEEQAVQEEQEEQAVQEVQEEKEVQEEQEDQEEQEVLLTGHEEQTSSNSVEIEVETKDDQSVTDASDNEESEESNSDCCLSDVEVPAEPPLTDHTGRTINPDKLFDLRQSELLEESVLSGAEEDTGTLDRSHEALDGLTGGLEMCREVDENVETKRSEADADDGEEAATQEAENAERIETSGDIQDVIETNYSDRTTSGDTEASLQPRRSEATEDSEQVPAEASRQSEEQPGQSQHPEPTAEMELTEATRPEDAEQPEESARSEQALPVEAEEVGATEQRGRTEPSERTERPPPETEVTQQPEEAEDEEAAEDEDVTEDRDAQTVVATKEQHEALPHMNGRETDRQTAGRLAERLFKLEGIQRADVVKHLDKDNDFSRAVGEEYLKFFDFTGQTLDHALRSFLKVVILIGETQERERVLQHFSCRFHQCNPDSFSSSGAVLALTCALMLLNTDLHGQNVGKSMSSSKFVSNLDGMNDGGNFSKELLKSLHNSIKTEPLEWAVDEEELKSSVLVDEDAADDAPLRSKSNPFQDVPHDKKALVVKQGFLQRKLHADIDGKRTPWGKRSWKTFYGMLKGMVLYLQKDDYQRDQPTNEEVVSVHHSLAEQAADYTKKPHVLRLQTADWRVFLFQASSKVEMNSWISRINLVSALHSSPPFPAAVGSQRRFCRPILPASQSAHTLEHQLQSHAGMLESFKADMSYLQQNPPEGRKAKARELEERRVRAEYLQHEVCRYENFMTVLEAWKDLQKTGDGALSPADLNLFDKAVGEEEEEQEGGGLKKSYSSPSLELEMVSPPLIKVKRNISERRTYRRTIIPRWNKEV